MPPPSPQDEPSIRLAHPLAERLADRLRERGGGRILEFAAGSGRNGEALSRAGFTVVAIDDSTAASEDGLESVTGPFDAVLSTHGLLHGTIATVGANVAAIARLLPANGLLCATFGSVRDARFGMGSRIDASTYAPLDGDERGVAHAFFTQAQLRTLLDRWFVIESLDERAVDEIAGSWAHRELRLSEAVHWFAIARRR
jgi:hypothetical protein